MKASEIKRGQRVEVNTGMRSHEIVGVFFRNDGKLCLDLVRIADGKERSALAENCKAIKRIIPS